MEQPGPLQPPASAPAGVSYPAVPTPSDDTPSPAPEPDTATKSTTTARFISEPSPDAFSSLMCTTDGSSPLSSLSSSSSSSPGPSTPMSYAADPLDDPNKHDTSSSSSCTDALHILHSLEPPDASALKVPPSGSAPRPVAVRSASISCANRKPVVPKRTLDAPDVFDMFDALHDENSNQYDRNKLRSIIKFSKPRKRKTDVTSSSSSSSASSPAADHNHPLPLQSGCYEDDISDEEIPEDVLMASYKQDIALLHHTFRHARRIVVIAGAGISVAAGIPDFRSTTGLFRLLRNELRLKGGVSSGQQMFDASHVFSDSQALDNFHTTMCDLYDLCQTCDPTPFHSMVDRISGENRLLRLYTQNIDCLDTSLPNLATKHPLNEEPWPKTVQLHGTISSMICSKCGWTRDFDPSIFRSTSEDTDTANDTQEGSSQIDEIDNVSGEEEDGYDSDNETVIEFSSVPECPECVELDSVRTVAGKRSQGVGKLRPKIVLYNEPNPDAEAIGQITEQDLLKRPDALIVVGTSLKIPGVRRMVREMSQAVHAARGCSVWMNIDDPSALSSREFDSCFDLIVKGDCQLIPQLLDDYEGEKAIYEETKTAERKVKAEARALRQKLAAEKKATLEQQRAEGGVASRSLSESAASSRSTSEEAAPRKASRSLSTPHASTKKARTLKRSGSRDSSTLESTPNPRKKLKVQSKPAVKRAKVEPKTAASKSKTAATKASSTATKATKTKSDRAATADTTKTKSGRAATAETIKKPRSKASKIKAEPTATTETRKRKTKPADSNKALSKITKTAPTASKTKKPTRVTKAKTAGLTAKARADSKSKDAATPKSRKTIKHEPRADAAPPPQLSNIPASPPAPLYSPIPIHHTPPRKPEASVMSISSLLSPTPVLHAPKQVLNDKSPNTTTPSKSHPPSASFSLTKTFPLLSHH